MDPVLPAVDGMLGHVKDDVDDLFKRTPSGKLKPGNKAMAGQIIARNYFVRRYCHYVKKKILVERLILEDVVGRGVVRLIVYSLLFIFIVFALNVGGNSDDKRRVSTLLKADLGLDDWLDIKGLSDLRELLPEISEGIKKFSASSNSRFDDDESVVILRNSQTFQIPRQLFSVDPSLTGDFTFTAWVKTSSSNQISILRRPMESDRDKDCWAWYHSSEFRYGAHDFHSNEDGKFFESVKGNTQVNRTELTHEAILVKDGKITFFRNGKAQAGAESIPLPRPITDCLAPAPLELGDYGGIELSYMIFYPRALAATDIDEMFQAGQPLVEVATASTVQDVQEENLVTVESAVSVTELLLTNEIQKSALETRINAIMDGQASSVTGDPLNPEDDSPHPILPKGDAVTDSLSDSVAAAGGVEESNRQAWLNGLLRQKWIAGGKQTTGYMNSTFRTDPGDLAALGQYYSVFETPVVCDGTEFGQLPNFDAQADGMTVSFWFKAAKSRLGYGPNLRVVQGTEENPTAYFQIAIQLDWVEMEIMTPNDAGQYVWRFMTGFDETTGVVNEKFLLYAFAQNSQPNVWRHLVFQYSMATKSILFYIDGVLFTDTRHSSDYGGTLVMGTASVAEIFNGGTIVPHSWKQQSSMVDVAGSMAQLRFYDRVLSAEQIQLLHTGSVWPSGSQIKQCKDGSRDFDFADTLRTDFYGNPCSWWFEQSKEYPWVCSAAWLKEMCPVTCAGLRICHDGSLGQLNDPAAEASTSRRKFRIFDRVMHLKPRGQTGLICPSDRLTKEEILQECRNNAENADYQAGGSEEWSFTRIFNRHNPEVESANLLDCDVLEQRLDFEQCQFNTSWVEDFRQDFEETKTWSISTWVRPKEGSFGMPTNFHFALTLFSTLAPPLILSDWNERQPKLEPWLDAWNPISTPDGSADSLRAAIWPTTAVDYAGSWTFLHMQYQERDDGSVQMCATLNALKLACQENADATHRFDPLRFIEGIELTTEMLISPIEISTEFFTPSGVQSKYYAKAPTMAKVLGPLQSELERVQDAQEQASRESSNFDQTVILMAPPLLLQRRASKRSCESYVTTPFLESQLALIQAAQCTGGVACPDARTLEAVATCIGTEEEFTGRYYGREKTILDGQEGFTDFLYAIADNPLVVRDGEILDTDSFFDAQSTQGTILAFFHLAETGLTTELKLTVEFSTSSVETDFEFQHYGFVKGDKKRELIGYYTFLFSLIALILILNFKFYVNFHNEVKLLGVKFDEKGRFEIAYDLIQLPVVCAFGVLALANALQTEETAHGIVSAMAAVPFEAAGISLEDKLTDFYKAVENLHQGFANNAAIDVFAFIIMVLMLLRIIDATAVHPRTGVLVGTLLHGLNDLWHFTILFLVVFFFFAFTSNWMFSAERDEFADLASSMQTQFNIIMGELPEDYREDERMIVYVVFSIVVQFFLMLNFLLAIVVEGYMKVRLDIEANESEGEFFSDVFKTGISYFKSCVYGWPHRRYVALIVRDKVGSRAVSGYHLLLQQLPHEAVTSMFSHYAAMDHLACGPPEWLLPANRYDVVDRVEKEAVKISVENLNSQMSAMRLQLSRVLASVPLGPTTPQAFMAPVPSGEGVLNAAIHNRIRNRGSAQHRRTSGLSGETGSPPDGYGSRKQSSRKLSLEDMSPKGNGNGNGHAHGNGNGNGHGGTSAREVKISDKVEETKLQPDDDSKAGKDDPEELADVQMKTVDLLVKQRKMSLEAAMHGNGVSNANERVGDEDFYMALQGGPGLQQLGTPTFMF